MGFLREKPKVKTEKFTATDFFYCLIGEICTLGNFNSILHLKHNSHL